MDGNQLRNQGQLPLHLNVPLVLHLRTPQTEMRETDIPVETPQAVQPHTNIIPTADGMVKFICRQDWHAIVSTEEPPVLNHPLSHAIITPTPLSGQFMSTPECVKAMQDMQKLYMECGLCDISFNFYVGNEGTIYEGRGWTVEGATARDWNHRSIAIAFIGKYVDNVPTTDALDALKLFLQYLVTQGILRKDFTIHCLRQIRQELPDAPGDALYRIIQGFKSNTEDGWTWKEKDNEVEVYVREGSRAVPLSQQYQDRINRNMANLAGKIVGPMEILESLKEKRMLKPDQYKHMKESLSTGDDGLAELNRRILSHVISGGSIDLALYLEVLLEHNQRVVANFIYKLLPKEERRNIHIKYRRQKEAPQYKVIAYEDLEFVRKNGDYHQLGSGSFGKVLLAKYLGLRVAVKQSADATFSNIERMRKCFLEEAEITYKLRHPHIVNMVGIVCDNIRHKHCIVMEYMEAGALADLLEKVRIPWPVKVRMLRDVAYGLLFLYTQQTDRDYPIIHCDVKARNILINGQFQAKVADFGKSVQQIITSHSSVAPLETACNGTLTHYAPELLGEGIGRNEANQKSDIWSFGITIFEVCAENVTGKEWRTPFPETMTKDQISIHVGTNQQNPLFANNAKQLSKIPRRGPDGCPNVLFDLMLFCCEMDPRKRPDGFKEVAVILDNGFKDLRSEYSQAMGDLYREYEEKVLNVTSVIRQEVGEHPGEVPMVLEVDDEYMDAISAIIL